MPEFLEDPSLLTKDRLKNELLANSVSLPSGEQRKDVYVQLYLQHLTARNRGAREFSSDEEREATPVRGRGRPPGRKATKKTDKPNVEERSGKTEQDVTELSSDALRRELLKYGITPGPIMATTRKIYEKRLMKLKEQPVTSITPVADTSNSDSNNQNGNSDPDQYSDNEEPKINLTFERREPIRGKSKTRITSRSRRLEQNEIVEKTFTEEKEDWDILKEMFPYETLTPTGISASCRRPIKGAAGRPISENYEEGYTSQYAPKYYPVHGSKVTKPKTGRSISMWIKILIFVILAVFLFLVYQVMETNEGNPFSVFLQGIQRLNKGRN
ncbi:PREDICTED: thymopoietin isoform X1 [Nanorana parkeri]|uniref:thymopoietin isoform X1 n=1 Tax=Nanorana parkeri TaxID=125878 RepID=UPI00085509DD|nr:PREDICTED: thymopoietin isoform X1 [Nanorana parkeri]